MGAPIRDLRSPIRDRVPNMTLGILAPADQDQPPVKGLNGDGEERDKKHWAKGDRSRVSFLELSWRFNKP